MRVSILPLTDFMELQLILQLCVGLLKMHFEVIFIRFSNIAAVSGVGRGDRSVGFPAPQHAVEKIIHVY